MKNSNEIPYLAATHKAIDKIYSEDDDELTLDQTQREIERRGDRRRTRASANSELITDSGENKPTDFNAYEMRMWNKEGKTPAFTSAEHAAAPECDAMEMRRWNAVDANSTSKHSASAITARKKQDDGQAGTRSANARTLAALRNPNINVR